MRRLFLLITLLLLVSPTLAQDSYAVKTRTARVRAEPSTTARVVATLRANTVLDVIEAVDGASVSGSTLWYHINVRNGTGYIHSSLVQAPAGGGMASSGSVGGDTVQPTSEPDQPLSTPVPDTIPVAPVQTGASCNGATTCSQMVSCEQAYACLASRPGLDRDKDGVPCESICPGG